MIRIRVVAASCEHHANALIEAGFSVVDVSDPSLKQQFPNAFDTPCAVSEGPLCINRVRFIGIKHYFTNQAPA